MNVRARLQGPRDLSIIPCPPSLERMREKKGVTNQSSAASRWVRVTGLMFLKALFLFSLFLAMSRFVGLSKITFW